MDDFDVKFDDEIVVLMIINLNILGLFDENILEIVKCVYDWGGLIYLDGVNMNVILGIIWLGDFGVDMMYFNLYKIFSGFYGGGGFGVGLICVIEELGVFFFFFVVVK